MNRLESALLAYFFNSLWQVPLAAAAGALSARILRPAGARVQHQVWVAALWAGSLLPAVSMLPLDRLQLGWLFTGIERNPASSQVSIQFGPGEGFAAAFLPPAAMHVLAVLFAAITLYFALRFLWRCAHISHLANQSTPLVLDPELALAVRHWSERLGVDGVALGASPLVFAPVALGFRRRWILLPVDLEKRLAPADFDVVIAHELAHIRRNDFLKNLCYELLALPVSYHPLLWLIRQRLMESREIVCDEMAAQIAGKREYVQSLLRLASLLVHGFAHPLPHGIGVFDANTLERRLMQLTRNSSRIGHARKALLVTLSIALATGACASALALRLSFDPGALSDDSSSASTPHSIPPDVLVRNIISKVPPTYPPDAKKARIQGTVVLDAVIGTTGDVEGLKVVSGPKELQQSSLDAVRQWKYKPFMLNGAPIEVKSTINIIYALAK